MRVTTVGEIRRDSSHPTKAQIGLIRVVMNEVDRCWCHQDEANHEVKDISLIHRNLLGYHNERYAWPSPRQGESHEIKYLWKV